MVIINKTEYYKYNWHYNEIKQFNKIKIMENFKEYIYNQHDIVCNQKYADYLPYSFHLKCVKSQGDKFKHLIEFINYKNEDNRFSNVFSSEQLLQLALTAHDTLEDTFITYNDLKELGTKHLGNTLGGEMLADIVYCVTDEKGKNRKERKNEKYYKELSENKLAVFVKLADISANTLFSKLTNSSMYKKYKSEFSHFKEMCYIEEYKEFFDYLQEL